MSLLHEYVSRADKPTQWPVQSGFNSFYMSWNVIGVIVNPTTCLTATQVYTYIMLRRINQGDTRANCHQLDQIGAKRFQQYSAEAFWSAAPHSSGCVSGHPPVSPSSWAATSLTGLLTGCVQMISTHMMVFRGCKTTVLLYHFQCLLVPSDSGSDSILVVQFGLDSCAIKLQCSVYPYTSQSSFPRKMNFTTDLIRIHPIKIESLDVCVLIWIFVLGWDVFLWLWAFFCWWRTNPCVSRIQSDIMQYSCICAHRAWWLLCNVYPAQGFCIWKAGRTY